MMPVLGAGALLGAAAVAPAAAQQPGGTGKGDSKDVIVDLSVLDQLGPAATVPSGGTIVLTPPGAKPTAKPAGKAQPATAGAKGRVAAESTPAAAKASSPPPPPPESAVESPAAAPGNAPDSTGGQPSESPNATAATAAETSAPPAPTSPPIESGASPPKGAAGAAQPPAPVAARPSSAPPPPAATESAAPAAPAPQLANKPSASPTTPRGPRGEKAFSLRFDSGAADLSDAARNELGKFAAILKKSNDQRLQVVAYAAGTEAEASQARRLALSRALAVRSYLIEQDISSARMDVRALGNKVEDAGPADRVDLVFIGNR